MNRSSKGGNSIEEEVVILKERERDSDTIEEQQKRINVVTI